MLCEKNQLEAFYRERRNETINDIILPEILGFVLEDWEQNMQKKT